MSLVFGAGQPLHGMRNTLTFFTFWYTYYLDWDNFQAEFHFLFASTTKTTTTTMMLLICTASSASHLAWIFSCSISRTPAIAQICSKHLKQHFVQPNFKSIKLHLSGNHLMVRKWWEYICRYMGMAGGNHFRKKTFHSTLIFQVWTHTMTALTMVFFPIMYIVQCTNA